MTSKATINTSPATTSSLQDPALIQHIAGASSRGSASHWITILRLLRQFATIAAPFVKEGAVVAGGAGILEEILTGQGSTVPASSDTPIEGVSSPGAV